MGARIGVLVWARLLNRAAYRPWLPAIWPTYLGIDHRNQPVIDAQRLHQLVCGLDANIRGEETFFHFFQGILVPLEILKDRANFLYPSLATFGQALFKPLKKCSDCHGMILCDALIGVKRGLKKWNWRQVA